MSGFRDETLACGRVIIDINDRRVIIGKKRRGVERRAFQPFQHLLVLRAQRRDAPLESALAAAREDARGLRDAHRSMSASLLAEIFDSYRLPNFREAFGFGDRLRKRADTTGETQLAGLEGLESLESLEGLEGLEGLETRAREAPGATLAECFVADEAAAARAAEVSAEVSAARASLPCGCGDCCAPKLLAECALRGLKPLSIAEVWMGVSTREEGDREEGEFYGACRGRCRPILGHMLCGADALNPRTKEKLGGPIVL